MRILLVEGEDRVRSALRLLLDQERDVKVVGESCGVTSLEALIQVTGPDVVLLSWDVPSGQAVAALHTLKENASQSKVLVLSSHPDQRQSALEAGADAFVCKADPPEVLLRTLQDLQRVSS